MNAQRIDAQNELMVACNTGKLYNVRLCEVATNFIVQLLESMHKTDWEHKRKGINYGNSS